jgi:hypothetical protein
MCDIKLLILLVILIYVIINKKEYFTDRNKQAEKRADTIITNEKFFNSDFYTTRTIIPWIDAITYEDVRRLKHNGKLNKNELVILLK